MKACLDNSKIERKLDWAPHYDLSKGVIKTFQWHSNHQNKIASKGNNQQKHQIHLKKVLLSVMPFIENVLAFAVLLMLLFLLRDNFSSYIYSYLLVYICAFGVYFGITQAIFRLR